MQSYSPSSQVVRSAGKLCQGSPHFSQYWLSYELSGTCGQHQSPTCHWSMEQGVKIRSNILTHFIFNLCAFCKKSMIFVVTINPKVLEEDLKKGGTTTVGQLAAMTCVQVKQELIFFWLQISLYVSRCLYRWSNYGVWNLLKKSPSAMHCEAFKAGWGWRPLW